MEKGKWKEELDGGWFEWAWQRLGWWQANPTVDLRVLGGDSKRGNRVCGQKVLVKRRSGSCEI